METLRPSDEEYIAEARALYASDDVEIDDNPALSQNDDGCWVAAWVWVTDEEALSSQANSLPPIEWGG